MKEIFMKMNIPETREELAKLSLTEVSELIKELKSNEEEAIKTLSNFKKFYFDGVSKKADLTDNEKEISSLIVQTLNSLNKTYKRVLLFNEYASLLDENDRVFNFNNIAKLYDAMIKEQDNQIKLYEKLISQAEKLKSIAIITLPEKLNEDIIEIAKIKDIMTPKDLKGSVKKKEAIDRIKKLDLSEDKWKKLSNLSEDQLASLLEKIN